MKTLSRVTGTVSGTSQHREDIDGLRAIAVLSVLLYHLDVPGLKGGFVGVDIFFVISGFVITRGIVRELEADKFSFATFLKRRALRIFPALFVVLLATLLAGIIVLAPQELAHLSQSALANIVAAPNIFYLKTSSYFSASARSMPLLHTWSLGVEWQYYLTAPLCMIVIWRALGHFGLLSAAILTFLASLGFELYASYILSIEALAFFSPASRFWELCIGSIAALASCYRTSLHTRLRPDESLHSPLGIRSAAAIVGASGLIYAITMIDDSTIFPGVTALVPTLSTVLLIAASVTQNHPLGWFLASSPMQFFGRISYSLYLVHWPIIVYRDLVVVRAITAAEQVCIFLITIVLAALLYHWIEVPFRRARSGQPWQRARGALLMASCVLLALSGALYAMDGLPQRSSPNSRAIAAATNSTARDEKTCVAISPPIGIPKVSYCSFAPFAPAPSILLWGDSHADMISEALDNGVRTLGQTVAVATLADCHPLIGVHTSKQKNRHECAQLGEKVLQLIKSHQIKFVVLASRWGNVASTVRAPGDGALAKSLFDTNNDNRPISFSSALAQTVKRLTDTGVRVVILGPVPEIDFDVPNTMMRMNELGRTIPTTLRADFMVRQREVLAAFKTISTTDRATIVFPHESLCDPAACMVADGIIPLYSDDDHLSPAGVARIMPPIIRRLSGSD